MKKFLLLFVLSACAEGDKRNDDQIDYSVQKNLRVYKYEYDLEFYLKEKFNQNISTSFQKDSLIFFFPLSSCYSCLKYSAESVVLNGFKGDIFISGDTSSFFFKDTIFKKLYAMKNVNFDLENSIAKYNLDIAEPVSLIKRNKQVYKIDLNMVKWPYFTQYLGWTHPLLETK